MTEAARCDAALRVRWAHAACPCFGHVGDGNVHVGVPLADSPAYGANSVERAVYEIAREMGGSISAKHGIGRLKRPFLGYSRSAAEIGVMRTMKGALDPLGISKLAFQFRTCETVQVVRPCAIPKRRFRAPTASRESDGIGQLAQQSQRHSDAMQGTAAVPIPLTAEERVTGIGENQLLAWFQCRTQFLNQHLSTHRAAGKWSRSDLLP